MAEIEFDTLERPADCGTAAFDPHDAGQSVRVTDLRPSFDKLLDRLHRNQGQIEVQLRR